MSSNDNGGEALGAILGFLLLTTAVVAAAVVVAALGILIGGFKAIQNYTIALLSEVGIERI